MNYRRVSVTLGVLFCVVAAAAYHYGNQHIRSHRVRTSIASNAITTSDVVAQEPSDWTAVYDSYVSGLETLATRSATAQAALTLFRNHAFRTITESSGQYRVVSVGRAAYGFKVTTNNLLPRSFFAQYDERTKILTINAERRLQNLVGGSVLAHELRHVDTTSGNRFPDTSRGKLLGEIDAYYLQAAILDEYTGDRFARILKSVVNRMLCEGPHEDGFDSEYRELVSLFPPHDPKEEPFPYRLMLTFAIYKYYEHSSPNEEVFHQRLEQRLMSGPAASELPTSPPP